MISIFLLSESCGDTIILGRVWLLIKLVLQEDDVDKEGIEAKI